MIDVNSVVRMRPVAGCCNSTLCFQEWEVINKFLVKAGEVEIPMCIIKSDDVIEIVRENLLNLVDTVVQH